MKPVKCYKGYICVDLHVFQRHSTYTRGFSAEVAEIWAQELVETSRASPICRLVQIVPMASEDSFLLDKYILNLISEGLKAVKSIGFWIFLWMHQRADLPLVEVGIVCFLFGGTFTVQRSGAAGEAHQTPLPLSGASCFLRGSRHLLVPKGLSR